MSSGDAASGFMVALYIVELIVVVIGVRWALRAHRRIGELERSVSFLQGRAGAPSATKINDPVAGKVYETRSGATTPQRPTLRP